MITLERVIEWEKTGQTKYLKFHIYPNDIGQIKEIEERYNVKKECKNYMGLEFIEVTVSKKRFKPS